MTHMRNGGREFLVGAALLLAGCSAASNEGSSQIRAAQREAATPQAGAFGGALTYTRPCSSDAGEPPFAGRIEQNRIVIRAARGLRINVELDADGRFAVEGVLRSHTLGTKMQSYVGRVAEGFVLVDARFVVPGYPQTECVATGRFRIAS